MKGEIFFILYLYIFLYFIARYYTKLMHSLKSLLFQNVFLLRKFSLFLPGFLHFLGFIMVSQEWSDDIK